MKKIDIVIVNWNSGNQIFEAIESIKRFGGEFVAGIYVVDNGSRDGSIDLIDEFENISIIRLNENLGFGCACNLGSKIGASKYILFLNPDASIRESTLNRVAEFMDLNESADVGICGVQLIDATGEVARSCSRFPSVTRFLARTLGLDRWRPQLGNAMMEWNHLESREVDQVIGAFFLVRRSLFESLGGFDERFFVYYEEVDFSLRAKQAGWRSIFFADAQAFHAGGGTSNQVKARRLFYSLRSRILYVHKHFSSWSALWVIAMTLVVEPVSRLAFFALRRSWSAVNETWQAYLLLWAWLPSWALRGETR